jgi:hypothetical protein
MFKTFVSLFSGHASYHTKIVHQNMSHCLKQIELITSVTYCASNYRTELV